MNKKTITQLNQLREGDRFVYKNRADVWEVMKMEGTHIEVNQVLDGKPVFRYNTKKPGHSTVMFLRHTKPLPGEKCFIEDLNEGDVFLKSDDVINEYEIVTKGKQFSKVKKVYDKDCEAPEMAGIIAEVILVRRKAEGV
jgi:hypothetical protein